MKLNYANGSYNISFFNMIIETNEELSQEVIRKNSSTFIHEFIHYLQDLILPYNIRYNLSNVRQFSDILHYAHSHGSIERPFDKWSNDSNMLTMQFALSFGSVIENVSFVNNVSKIGYAASDFSICSGFDSYLRMQREHRIYYYILPVFENNKSIPYHLGARDLLEYIAYKIELKNFPDRPKAPQLPYKSIDFIFNQYGLSHISNDIRLCIAERCLYNDNPIHFLLNTLLDDDEFKKYISNSSYEDIYKYLYFSITVTRDGQSESLIDKTQRRLKQFVSELQMQYGSFNEIEKWILKVNDFVEERLNGRFIFSDLYTMNNNEVLRFINEAINYIGVPLVMNLEEKYISVQTNEVDVSQFIQFFILQNFISFVKSKQKICPIYGFCKANGGNCNENCVLDKQKMIKGNDDCYYRKFLKAYGLLDISFN